MTKRKKEDDEQRAAAAGCDDIRLVFDLMFVSREQAGFPMYVARARLPLVCRELRDLSRCVLLRLIYRLHGELSRSGVHVFGVAVGMGYIVQRALMMGQGFFGKGPFLPPLHTLVALLPCSCTCAIA
jgi:hypothetical protein